MEGTSSALPVVGPRRAPPRYGEAGAAFTVGDARGCIVVPAYQAGSLVGAVLDELLREFGCAPNAIVVVDDGSTDATGERADERGVRVVRLAANRGKGAALVRGMEEGRARGFTMALTVDADGQHPAHAARAVASTCDDPAAFVLGVRDLLRDGAPRKNRVSNGISNFFLSRFAGRSLADTQCGLRRYPIDATLALGSRAAGYAFEAEVLLRAVRRGLRVVEQPVDVYYPPEDVRLTHFDSVRDPMRIVGAVVRTLVDLRRT